MAYVRWEYCNKCEKDTQHINSKCVDCVARQKRLETAAWNALTVEEKLVDLRKRVEALERPEPTY